jgi:ring-1,2-phenylacetyl-CoA epoxidase subunit PaaD
VVTPAAPTPLDELVREIDDPELPHVTIGDLGIVRSVTIDGGTATVVLTPTYTACPATEQICDDVAETVRRAGYVADVRMTMSPAWTTDWITPRGRDRLHAAGIAPPTPLGTTVATSVGPPVACPRCGSRRTRLVSQFGGTACKASYACNACDEPFELFKPL